jgi:hypothetical protein
VDLSDEASLVAALRETYGPFADVMDMRRIIDEIWDPRNDPGDSRRYFLNQPTSATDAFIAEPEWRACQDEDKVIRPRDLITIGFDGSRGRAVGKPDATALIGCRVHDGHLFEIGVWEADYGPGMEDWEPPITEIEAAIAEAFSKYSVVGFYADPAKDWRAYVNSWEAKYARRVKVKVTQAHPFEWWMTGGRAGLNERAIEQFLGAVLNGDLSHSGEFNLTRHILNARRRVSHNRLALAKKHSHSPDKIDAAIAAVLAWQARLDALAKGIGSRTASIPVRIR